MAVAVEVERQDVGVAVVAEGEAGGVAAGEFQAQGGALAAAENAAAPPLTAQSAADEQAPTHRFMVPKSLHNPVPLIRRRPGCRRASVG